MPVRIRPLVYSPVVAGIFAALLVLPGTAEADSGQFLDASRMVKAESGPNWDTTLGDPDSKQLTEEEKDILKGCQPDEHVSIPLDSREKAISYLKKLPQGKQKYIWDCLQENMSM